MPPERSRKMKAKKYLRKSCCHRIECHATNFLTAFMWKRLLNNIVLTILIHRKPEGVSDGTNTQVVAQMINKCRFKIVQEELYKRRDPPWIKDLEKDRRDTVAI